MERSLPDENEGKGGLGMREMYKIWLGDGKTQILGIKLNSSIQLAIMQLCWKNRQWAHDFINNKIMKAQIGYIIGHSGVCSMLVFWDKLIFIFMPVERILRIHLSFPQHRVFCTDPVWLHNFHLCNAVLSNSIKEIFIIWQHQGPSNIHFVNSIKKFSRLLCGENHSLFTVSSWTWKWSSSRRLFPNLAKKCSTSFIFIA